MSGWLRTLRHALGEALGMLSADPIATALALCVMGVSFAAALAAIGFLIALPGLPARLGVAPVLTVYLEPDAADADAAMVETRLRAQAGVTEVRRIGRAAALHELGRSMGLDGIADALPRNPLPETVVATLRDPAFDALERLRAAALGWPKVDAALFDRDASKRLDATMRLARDVGLASCVALALLAIGALATATLRWLPAIRSTRIPGDTPARRAAPALYAGALQALAAVVVAAVVLATAACLLAADAMAAFGWATARPGVSTRFCMVFFIISVAYIFIGATLSAGMAISVFRMPAEK